MSVNNILNSGNPSPSWVKLRTHSLLVDDNIGSRIFQTNATTKFLNPPVITPVYTTSTAMRYCQFGQFVFLSLSFAKVTTLATSMEIFIQGFDELIVPTVPQVANILIIISGEYHNTCVKIDFDLNGVNLTILPPATLPNFSAADIELPQQVITYVLT